MPYWRLFYHSVWSTRERQPLIDPGWESNIFGYLWGKLSALDCIPHAIGGMPDHLHVVLSIPPRLAIATIIGLIKGSSSHRINEKYLGGSFAWQAEYSVFSISESGLSKVASYVKNQKQHHAESTTIGVLEDIPNLHC